MQPTSQTYNELQTAYDHFNKTLFNGILPPCLLTLQREKKTYGYFAEKRFIADGADQEIDEIALNPVYFGRPSRVALPHQETMQTIVHEMAHLWQSHFGTPGRRRYHNKEWGDKMESIGLMPSSTGRPGGKKTGECVADYAIEGGRFLASCKELLNENFCISWRDRFAVFAAIETGETSFAPTLIQEMSILTPVKPQTRVKYTCPECETNVWGKPNLNLVCGDCEVSFEAVN